MLHNAIKIKNNKSLHICSISASICAEVYTWILAVNNNNILGNGNKTIKVLNVCARYEHQIIFYKA